MRSSLFWRHFNVPSQKEFHVSGWEVNSYFPPNRLAAGFSAYAPRISLLVLVLGHMFLEAEQPATSAALALVVLRDTYLRCRLLQGMKNKAATSLYNNGWFTQLAVLRSLHPIHARQCLVIDQAA